jgi:hypothetical protein
VSEYQYRKNDGEWLRLESIDDFFEAIYSLGKRDTLKIRVECDHDATWIDHGIKICKDCGEHLAVTSYGGL